MDYDQSGKKFYHSDYCESEGMSGGYPANEPTHLPKTGLPERCKAVHDRGCMNSESQLDQVPVVLTKALPNG